MSEQSSCGLRCLWVFCEDRGERVAYLLSDGLLPDGCGSLRQQRAYATRAAKMMRRCVRDGSLTAGYCHASGNWTLDEALALAAENSAEVSG